ncbi:MAG: glutamate--tRNA ligase [Planctomycetota bacterium]
MPSDALRTRFAPSPTGPLHIGGARTALFCWALARRHGGAFLLRIEDTDPERSKREWEQEILEGFRWLGIDWDEGPDVGGPFEPYRQSDRLDGHLATARKLLEEGLIYPCFCTRERLERVREEQQANKQTPRYDGHCRDLPADEAAQRIAAGEPHVLRFRVPEGSTTFTDAIRGEVTFAHVEVDDWIVVRGDGAPTYNFVCVCDDSAMRISHVVRGEEHLVNTPKQILLYRALGLEPPSFAHLPLMLGKGGKKMSKRDGDTGLAEYRKKGYPAEAVVNFLCLQGWALDGEREVFSRAELVEHFALEAVSKGGSRFDIEKFDWLSGEYLRGQGPAELVERGAPFLIDAGLTTQERIDADRAWYERAAETARERITTYADLADQLDYLFADNGAVAYDPKALKGSAKHGPEVLSAWSAWADGHLSEPGGLGEATKAWIGEQGYKIPQLFQPLRCALTGKPGGADLFEIIALLGPERTRARVAAGLERMFD